MRQLFISLITISLILGFHSESFANRGPHAKRHKVRNDQMARIKQSRNAKKANLLKYGPKSKKLSVARAKRQLKSALKKRFGSKKSAADNSNYQPIPKNRSLIVAPKSTAVVKHSSANQSKPRYKTQDVLNNYKARYKVARQESIELKQHARATNDTYALRQGQFSYVRSLKSLSSYMKKRSVQLQEKAANSSDPKKQSLYRHQSRRLIAKAAKLDKQIHKHVGNLLDVSLKAKDLRLSEQLLRKYEKSAAKTSGLSGMVNKFKVWNAKRRLRKTAYNVAHSKIEDPFSAGSAAAAAELKQHQQMNPDARREIGAEIRRLKNNNGYDHAKRILNKLEKKEAKRYSTRGFFGKLKHIVYTAPSFRLQRYQLDKHLLKKARALQKTGNVNDGFAARLLLHTAKTQKHRLGNSLRYKVVKRLALSSVNNTIKRAIKEGNPQAVAEAYDLKTAYQMDEQGPNFKISKKQEQAMVRDQAKARKNLIGIMLAMTSWISNNSHSAQFLPQPPAVDGQNNDYMHMGEKQKMKAARSTWSALALNQVSNHMAMLKTEGVRIPLRYRLRYKMARKRLALENGGILGKIALLPGKTIKKALGVVDFFTMRQVRAIVNPQMQGMKKPPVSVERFVGLIDKNIQNTIGPAAYEQQLKQQQMQQEQMYGYAR